MYGNGKAYFQSSMVHNTGSSLFIHSFIHLFAFCKSIQGLRQPIGYRICHKQINMYKLKDVEFYYIVYMYVTQAHIVSSFLFYLEKL